MQVDRVQSSNYNCSFGALRIKKEALPALKKASQGTLQMIDRVGEDVKEVIEPTLYLTKDLRTQLVWNNGVTITGKFRPQKPNIWTYKNLFFRARQDTDLQTGIPIKPKQTKFSYKLGTYDQAKGAFKRMKAYTSDIERAAELVKISEGIFDGSTKVTQTKFIKGYRKLFAKYGE